MNQRNRLNDMYFFAKKHNGKCLSKEYLGYNNKLLFECENKHQWLAFPCNILRDKWCKKCSIIISNEKQKKYSINDMHLIAQERNGRCLSTSYNNSGTKLSWECKLNHVWEATPDNILRGRWCKKCNKYKNTLIDMQRRAIKKGGKCLSTIYINAFTKLEWECNKGHTWRATPVSILTHWCPYCKFPTEQSCRDYFENIFSKKFPKTKPKWLNGLELDGYCDELKIAFEYQGEQHYILNSYFNRYDNFDLRRENDIIKKNICESRGITLIEIPYTVKNNIQKFILSEVRLRGVML